jgi:tRNA (adenine37-N6)-methyltransferase
MQIIFHPIGTIHTGVTDDELRDKRRVGGQIEIHSEFAPALHGIDGYSHLFVLVYFHRLRPEQTGALQVKPRGLLRKGYKLDELPSLGVFSIDSPTRPNPIGLTLVQFVRREANRLYVSGLDFFDGTPVLDIKGYCPDYRAGTYELPDWYRKLADESGHI